MQKPFAAASTLALMVVLASCTPRAPDTSPVPTMAPPTQASASPSASSASPTSTISVRQIDAPWTRTIQRLIGRQHASVSVGVGATIVFTHRGTDPMLPASDEKILTSLAALATLGPGFRFPTRAASISKVSGGTLEGDLWVVGSGDPELTDASLGELARALYSAGLRHVGGSVIGDTSTFDRGWWAPGWLPGISRQFVTRPTALALDGNTAAGMPELNAASSLVASLRAAGIRVDGSAKAGRAPAGLKTLAAVRSDPLGQILKRQNHGSINFDAEMIAKALGARGGGPGSTASGAAAIQTWAATEGVFATVRDGSGLSHQDRTTTDALVSLLLEAQRGPEGRLFYESLPAPGQGTLSGRLAGVPVRAKTGTLFITPASALSGYVRDAGDQLVAFSILSEGMDGSAAKALEDSIVRILAAARVGS